MFNFKFNEAGDYKVEFKAYVTQIIQTTKQQTEKGGGADTLANRSLRIQIINDLVNCYVATTDSQPDTYQVEKLTNAILHEELTDNTSWKTRQSEYPFLSEYQFGRRRGEEVSFKKAEEVGTDRKTYRKPTRRLREGKEDRHLDRVTKSRNDQRRKNYRDFISGKNPGLFTVNIATGEKITHKEVFDYVERETTS